MCRVLAVHLAEKLSRIRTDKHVSVVAVFETTRGQEGIASIAKDQIAGEYYVESINGNQGL